MTRVLMTTLALMFAFGPMVYAASVSGESAASAEVKALRVGSGTDRLRLVVDIDKEVDYDTMVLANPGRVVVNLHNSRLNADVERDRALQSSFASRVRVGQFDKNTVRIVVETEAAKGSFDVFSIEGGASPYRVVIDIGRLSGGKGREQSAPQPTVEKPSSDRGATGDDNAEKPTDKNSERGAENQGTSVAEQPNQQDGAQTSDASGDTTVKGNKAQEREEDQTDKTTDKPIELPDLDLDDIELSSKLKGKKIAIDPGHGGEDPGAIGPTGVTEKSITLGIAKVAQQLLEDAGAKVIMTRTTDTEVSPKHRQATDVDELQARCDIANKAGADVFISIHMDSFASRKASGTTGYYYEKGSAASKRLAALIQAAIIKQIRTESRGVKSCNFYVVRHTKMPATLIEVAFVSNPLEEKLLNSEKGIQYAAVGLVTGIAAFFEK